LVDEGQCKTISLSNINLGKLQEIVEAARIKPVVVEVADAAGGRRPRLQLLLRQLTFDGARLVTRVDAASDPSRVGRDQARGVRFEGGI
jgi:hypothetical protein